MPGFYGVRVNEQATAATAPVIAQSGVMAFGTAPVFQTGGPVNKIVVATTYEDAVKALGYSEDWGKYTLCEAIYSHFMLYGAAPLLLVNVLDPSQNKTAVAAADKAVSGGQVVIAEDVIPSSVVVKASASAESAAVKGTDYDVFFQNEKCVIEILSGGSLANAATINVAYDKVTFTLSNMATAVIGGYDVSTGASTGIELADQAYFETKYIPDILIAPGFSDNTGVAAVLCAKAKSLSTVFRSFAVCDLPANAATSTYTAAVQAKSASGSFQNVKECVCWPKLKLGDRTFHFSTHMAGLMAQLSAQSGGIPSEPPSNKTIQADAAVLDSGAEVQLDLTKANHLRGQGVVTSLNFVNGFASWGAFCACAPGNSDPKDMYINTARLVNFIANTVILTFWQYIDRKMNSRLAGRITDELNIWMNGLTNQGHITGGRCVLNSAENPNTDLMAGIVRPHIYVGLPGPVQTIDFIVEYDPSYLSVLF